MISINNWRALISHGFELKSSGTTGFSKTIFQTPEKLKAANQVAIDAQRIARNSRILTVCNMNHAGGVLAQTLPALTIGAEVEIKPFHAYRFWQDIDGFTHTHLTPRHCQLLMNTRTFSEYNFNGLFIACGSDNVSFEIIEAFVKQGAIFMCNWGMTEIGPITINTIFDRPDSVQEYKKHSIESGTLMGDRIYCDYKIDQGELWVKGPLCVYDDWFNTQDLVKQNDRNHLYHLGRHS